MQLFNLLNWIMIQPNKENLFKLFFNDVNIMFSDSKFFLDINELLKQGLDG